MAAIELALASPLDNQPVQSMRVMMGSTPVLTSLPGTLPLVSMASQPLPLLHVCMTCGAVDHGTQLSASLGVSRQVRVAFKRFLYFL